MAAFHPKAAIELELVGAAATVAKATFKLGFKLYFF
jgi:hypothetical protein